MVSLLFLVTIIDFIFTERLINYDGPVSVMFEVSCKVDLDGLRCYILLYFHILPLLFPL